MTCFTRRYQDILYTFALGALGREVSGRPRPPPVTQVRMVRGVCAAPTALFLNLRFTQGFRLGLSCAALTALGSGWSWIFPSLEEV